MSSKLNSRNKDTRKARLASQPYLIELGEQEYTLADETLKKHVDSRITKSKEWWLPKLKFIAFRNGKVEFRNVSGKDQFKLIIQVEPNKLEVICSCNESVEKLCLHAYRGLHRLIWYDTPDYFKIFKPMGLIQLAVSHKRFFDIKPIAKGIDASPNEELGSVFEFEMPLKPQQLIESLKLPIKPTSTKSQLNTTVITYLILESHNQRLFPSIIPCIGILNKAKSNIKSYGEFISGVKRENQTLLNDEQKALNSLAFNLWSLVEIQPGKIIRSDKKSSDEKAIQLAYDLWETAIPLLRQQRFLKRYYFFGPKELTRRRKPGRKRISSIKISDESPQLSFRLINKGAISQLELLIHINGREIKNYNTDITFFIRKDENLYFLSSLRDAAIVEWMRRSNDLITVFKEHYAEFEKSILLPLKSHFAIR